MFIIAFYAKGMRHAETIEIASGDAAALIALAFNRTEVSYALIQNGIVLDKSVFCGSADAALSNFLRDEVVA
jgi:hypothetical protein